MIRLAVRPQGRSPDEDLKTERLAQAAGLTGAEIDAARQGRSFDVRANGAIALALSVAAADDAGIARDRLAARSCGLSPADIGAVEREAQGRP
jgi:hypothetical protein